MYLKTLFMMGVLSAMLGAAHSHAAEPIQDSLDRPALQVRFPGKAYYTALAHAGANLVGVGEHGLIAVSSDGGATWRQSKVPASVTLTAVQFVSKKIGWAAGHYGVILHTADGGLSWTRQLDGVRAAQLVLDDARQAAGQGAQSGRYLADAERLVLDGPDKPFLALHFTDERNGVAVGAYNLALRTSDGGATWTPFMRQLDNPRGSHLYAVRGSGDAMYIAGEMGLLLRSLDGGRTFARLDTGYQGSFFALSVGSTGSVLVAGMRGNAFRSVDRGATWVSLDNPVPVSVTAVAPMPNGSLLLGNQAGQVLVAPAGGGRVFPMNTKGLPPVNDLLIHSDGSVVVASMFGVRRLTAPQGAPISSIVAQ